jgi:hypothetical protein
VRGTRSQPDKKVPSITEVRMHRELPIVPSTIPSLGLYVLSTRLASGQPRSCLSMQKFNDVDLNGMPQRAAFVIWDPG